MIMFFTYDIIECGTALPIPYCPCHCRVSLPKTMGPQGWAYLWAHKGCVKLRLCETASCCDVRIFLFPEHVFSRAGPVHGRPRGGGYELVLE